MKIIQCVGILSVGLLSICDCTAAVTSVEACEDALSAGHIVIPGDNKLLVSLDHDTARYACGETAVFSIVDDRDIEGPHKLKWTLDNYGEKVIARGDVEVEKGKPVEVRGTLAAPGFLRLTVKDANGKQRLRVYSAAFDCEKIKVTLPKPSDFDKFWKDARAKLEKEVPADPVVEPVPGWPKNGVCLSRVSFRTTGGRRVHGVLSYPEKAANGPLPLEITFPGAGPGFMIGSCASDKRIIRLTMNSHYYRIADDKAELDASYDKEESAARALHGPNKSRAYPVSGFTRSREEAHYYGIILGCLRAIDWALARPDVDAKRVCYRGGSQGGGFGLILAGLEPRIGRVFTGVPALTDLFSCKVDGRQSGWPRILEYETQKDPERLAAIEKNARYFDAVYFAENIHQPIRMSVGYADDSCAPHAVLSAFNAIPSKDKALYHGIGGSHASPNAPRKEVSQWLFNFNNK